VWELEIVIEIARKREMVICRRKVIGVNVKETQK
jgi:hypothetical protein